MNDETKAAADAALVESMVRQLQDCVSVGDEMTLDHASLIDDTADWIAGEPARLAAALENLREACARHVADGLGGGLGEAAARAVRRTPLDATPLEDENAALRARVAELEADVNAWRDTPARILYDNQRNRAERAEAQVAAARAWAKTALDHHEMYGEDESGAYALLRAMDEAGK